jgi:hypothetical protein
MLAGNYMHTDPAHAHEMLAVADHLGAGLGAPSEKTTLEHSLGSVYLRLWIGRRRLGR